MQQKFVAILAGGLMALTATGVHAAATIYGDYATFAADAAGLGLILKEVDWEAFGVGTPLTGNEFQPTHPLFYAPLHGTDMVVADDIRDQTDPLDTATGEGRTFTRGFGCPTDVDGVVIGSTGVPLYALGVWIIDSDLTDDSESIMVHLLQTTSQPAEGFPAGPSEHGGTPDNIRFFGAIVHPDDFDRIASMELDEGSDLGVVDNVSYGAVVYSSELVPEPATLGLLGLGVMGTVVLRWRRRRR
jgi:hypothetical protein